MKIRNGFVSNSSSSSFIITIEKNKKLRLSEIESYVGGYSDELTDDLKDTLSYFIWKTIKDKSSKEVEPIEHHEECTASWDEKISLKKKGLCYCPRSTWDHGERAPLDCEGCEFLKKEDRVGRSDDYYEIRDNIWIKNSNIISEDKENYYITIDDNDPGDYLNWEDAYALRQADKLFKSNDIAVETE